MTDDEWQTRFQRVYNVLAPRALSSAGYFSIAEADQLGLTEALRAESVARGTCVIVDDAVMRMTMQPASPHERWIVAWMRCGRNRVLLSHETALAAFGLADHSELVHITISTTRDLPVDVPPHVVIHRGDVDTASFVGLLPVTSAERTLDECEAAGIDLEVLTIARSRAERERGWSMTTSPSIHRRSRMRRSALRSVDRRTKMSRSTTPELRSNG